MDDMLLERMRVLACLAQSPMAGKVARWAARLARILDARLLAVHAGQDTSETRQFLEALFRVQGGRGQETDGCAEGSESPEGPEAQESRKGQMGGELESGVEILVEEGRPEEVIRQTAWQCRADLIVAGAIEKENFIEHIFGSTARRAARKAPCPVWLIPRNSGENAAIRHVVLNLAFDEHLAGMLDFALPLIRGLGARNVHLVSECNYVERMAARSVDSPLGDLPGGIPDPYAGTRGQLASCVDAFDFSGFDLETQPLEGAGGLESVEYARRVGADLLVYPAPSRPLTFWDRFFQHPAELVLEHIPCSLLLYRPKQAVPSAALTPTPIPASLAPDSSPEAPLP